MEGGNDFSIVAEFAAGGFGGQRRVIFAIPTGLAKRPELTIGYNRNPNAGEFDRFAAAVFGE